MLRSMSAARLVVAPALVSAMLLGSLLMSSEAQAADPGSRYYSQNTDGIFWFMHISDTHVKPTTAVPRNRMLFALGEAVEIIHPIAVFNTGDIVDGARAGAWGIPLPTAGQDENEWITYDQIMYDTGVTEDFYFDCPGNHDSYDDNGLVHYLNHGLQGLATKTALFADKVQKTKLGSYYFIATNSAGTYGTPFTFGNPLYTHVEEMKAGLAENAAAKLVFVFAHHHLVEHGKTDAQAVLNIGGADSPAGNAAEVLDMLESAGAFYLHGHVHQYKESMQGKVVTVQLGALKSESVDVDRSTIEKWDKTKFGSNMGVGIIDHNAFVYAVTDTANPWPVVAITAPVDAFLKGGGIPAGKQLGFEYEGDYLAYGEQENPYAYTVCLDREDNPVRAVVLSKSGITSVKVSLDSSEIGTMTPTVLARLDPNDPGEPVRKVYTTKINTKGLEPGYHSLTVTAVAGGKTRSDTIQVMFTPGPCEPFFEPEPDPPDSGQPDVDTPDIEDPTDGEPTDVPEKLDSGVPDVNAGDATDDATVEDDIDTDDGCSCRVVPRDSGGALGGVSALLFGIFAVGCRVGLRAKRRVA